jgi:hypothetical protein
MIQYKSYKWYFYRLVEINRKWIAGGKKYCDWYMSNSYRLQKFIESNRKNGLYHEEV